MNHHEVNYDSRKNDIKKINLLLMAAGYGQQYGNTIRIKKKNRRNDVEALADH